MFSYGFSTCPEKRSDFVRRLIQLNRCGEKTTFAHDVVPFENRSGFVPRHLHCYPLRYARAYQISDGRSPEVVRNSARNASGFASLFPGAPEFADRLPAPVEYQGADDALLLQDIGLCLLPLQERAKFAGEVENAASVILRGPGLEKTILRETIKNAWSVADQPIE